jgi:hypothetical protein
MNFHELVHKYKWDDVWPALLRLYPDQEKSAEGYQRAFETLQALAPVETKMRIWIEAVTEVDTGEHYAAVSGKDGTLKKDSTPGVFKDDDVGNQEESFGIEFVDWDEWLGMEIAPETLSSYSELDILGHCLWEMTFYGYSPGHIKRAAREIFQSGKGGKTLHAEFAEWDKLGDEALVDFEKGLA